ncbi:hypothetical protein B0H14DRAFT_3153853, partial [Mycena olivaceomarginata]
MPQPIAIQIRLNTVTTCLTMAANSLEILADTFNTPFLGAIVNTTHTVLKKIETVKQNKDDCVQLLEQTHNLLNAIIILHIRSDTGGEMPPSVLHHIRRFTETLHKIHTFFETQQKTNKVKSFFRQGEVSTLLEECKAGLQHGLEFFQSETAMVLADMADMQRDTQKRHQEVLDMIATLSDSDGGSTISKPYSQSYKSSDSITMLPSEPKIFHGRNSEILDILQMFNTGTPRIAILGAGGMGKSSLARALLHHPKIMGLKLGKDLTQPVIQHFSSTPPSLLILDELETLWEPAEFRSDIEELLSLLTGVDHLALMITMCGAERPAKVQWTRPFLKPLQPLDQEAARLTFSDIADNVHDLEEVDKVLSLTDNMPLAVNLLAHLADLEGCSHILFLWEKEKTSLVSDGFDKRSNLDLSISLSLSSPRLKSLPQSQELLCLLSMLPDGLLDVDLIQSKLPLQDILKCKTVLKSTALAYSDESHRLKVLMPIREYIQKHWPPADHLVRNLLKYFQDLLELYMEDRRTQSSSNTVPRIASNFVNIQNILGWGLKQSDPDFSNSINCACWLTRLSRVRSQAPAHLISQLHNILPQLSNHRLQVYVITQIVGSWFFYQIPDPEALISCGLDHLEYFDDPEIESQYYYEFKPDLVEATNMCQRAISLSTSTGHIKHHSQALRLFASFGFRHAEYLTAGLYARQSQGLARLAGDLYGAASAARMEAICWQELGHYRESLSLCIMAQKLLGLCGMSGSESNLGIMNTQAEIYKYKSEYSKARNIHHQILQTFSMDQDPYWHAEIVQRNINLAQSIFTNLKLEMWVTSSEAVLATLYLREKNCYAAKLLLEKCFAARLDNQIKSFCLERLGNVSQWGTGYSMSSWTTIFLVHSLKCRKKLEVHKALQFFGEVFLHQKDEDTAITLFTVALEGFTYMDVHQGRAECMSRLGDISKGHGDLLKAVELWNTARPLFERSCQMQEVKHIDERLSSVDNNALEQYRENLACLASLNVSSGEDNVSMIEDEEQVDFVGEHQLIPV